MCNVTINTSEASRCISHIYPAPHFIAALRLVRLIMSFAGRLVFSFPPRRPVFDPSLGYIRIVMSEVTLGQVFSEYFGFPFRLSSHRLLHSHLSFRAGTTGPLIADVPSGLALTTLQELKKKFWEEIIAYFSWYDTGHIENDVSNNSSIVACVFVTAVTFVRSGCLTTIGGIHTHTQTATSSHKLIFIFSKEGK
jgi:hypothetical protein